MTLTVGSLCAGAGMLDLALASLLDVRQAWHAEVDPAASKVLATHWPDAPNHGDITAVDWASVGQVEVLCGGIPCQGWSMAGKRKGSDDERDLWPIRKTDEHGLARRGALDAIRDLRPRLFVLENVPGLLTAENGAPFGTILSDLDALGYAASWTIVGACRVGACHHRHRLFLAAVPAELVADTDRLEFPPSSWRTPTGWQSTAGTLFGDGGPVSWSQAGLVVDGHAWPLPADPCGASGVVTMFPTPTAHCEPNARGLPNPETAARRMFEEGRRNLEDAVALLPTPTARVASRGSGKQGPAGRPLSEVIALLPTPVATDADGGPRRRNTHGKPMLPGAVGALLPTPTVADSRGTRNATAGRSPGSTANGGWTLCDVVYAGRFTASDARGIDPLLPTPRASDAVKGGPNQRGSSGDLMLPAAVQPGRFGVYETAVRRQESAFSIPAPEPTEPGRLGKPRLAPAFPEWMMGCPPGWITDHVGRNDAIRIAGNGVVWQSAAYALTRLPTFQAFAVQLAAPEAVVGR